MLQPLLYALAAGKLLGGARGIRAPVVLHATRGVPAIEIPVTPQARARVQRVLETIDDAIRGGFLPAAPQRDACGRCDYRAACSPYRRAPDRQKTSRARRTARGVEEHAVTPSPQPQISDEDARAVASARRWTKASLSRHPPARAKRQNWWDALSRCCQRAPKSNRS